MWVTKTSRDGHEVVLTCAIARPAPLGQNLENPMTLKIRTRDLLRLMAAGAVAVLAGCASAPAPRPVVAPLGG